MNLIREVKKKKEFSGLPDSVVKRALAESGDDVKEARSLLRKYFGVFLTNRVLKGKGDLLGIQTPVTRSILTVMSTMVDINYWEGATTLEQMGLAGLNRHQIVKYVTDGKL